MKRTGVKISQNIPRNIKTKLAQGNAKQQFSFKTFYFVSHQLYIWSWSYFTRHEETLSGTVSAGAGGAHSPAWLAVGAATGNGGRVTQLSPSCHPAVTSCCQAAADCRPGLGVGETSQNVVTAYVMLPSCWHPSFPDHRPPPTTTGYLDTQQGCGSLV